MKISDAIDELQLQVKTCKDKLSTEVTGAYVSDLLSDVMGNLQQGNIWITLQIHMNIVAIASLKNAAAIITIGGRSPQYDVLEKAASEKVVIMSTPLSAFETAGRLYSLLNK
ncbi:MAG: serine kinase [Nitrospira sp.]|nr:serine kinase [bacterium]MBL7048501.1 serine kinase [Nitrospira sp.]